MLMIGQKWSNTKLCALASAYKDAVRPRIGARDRPVIMPTTELRDVVVARLQRVASDT